MIATERSCPGCGETLAERHFNVKWCSDRCRKAQYDKQCVDCGARISGTDPGKSQGRCQRCSPKALASVTRERQRERFKDRRELVERMWSEGATGSEIEAAIGCTFNSGASRARGYDLPYRRTPEQRERIRAGRLSRDH